MTAGPTSSRTSDGIAQTGIVSEPADFIVTRLEAEGDSWRGEAERERIGLELTFIGASVGAVRGTVRDALLRYRDVRRVQPLASELWEAGVFEARLAAIVLLQTRVAELDNADLTRIEGFVRTGRHRALVDPLAHDVLGPLTEQLHGTARAKAETALLRWAADPDAWVRRAALLAPLRSLRAGHGDPDAAARRLRATGAAASAGSIATEAAVELRAALEPR